MEVRLNTAVSLNTVEQRLARFIARSRFEQNRQSQVTNAKRGDQSNEETDLEGVAAEIAFCKLCHVYPCGPLDLQPRSSSKGEDADADVVVNGRTVDVKSTKYPNGKLIAVPWKGRKCADYFALMTGVFPDYTFRGFMAGSELIRDERLGTLGHGPTYIAHQSELTGHIN